VVPQRTLTLLRRLARTNGAAVDATTRDLVASWVKAWADLTPGWQAAIGALVEQYERTGAWPPPWQAARIEAIARAQQTTERSLTGLLTDAATSTRTALTTVSEATLLAEPSIIASQRAGIEALAPSQRAVAGALAARQQRAALLYRPVVASTMDSIRRLLDRLPVVRGPLAPALLERIRTGFTGALVRATTIARTETVDGYRDTSALVHDTNRRILTAWAWHCSCDRRSCSGCWSMHGRQFPIDQAGPNGHPSCRCTRLALTSGVDLPSAEARFLRLSRRDQAAILGPGRLDFYRSGQVGWQDLATLRSHAGWRDAYVPTSLADLNRIAAVRASQSP
jgi:hypothetical protein